MLFPSHSWEPKVSYDVGDSASHLTEYGSFVIRNLRYLCRWSMTLHKITPWLSKLLCFDEIFSSHDSNIILEIKIERERI